MSASANYEESTGQATNNDYASRTGQSEIPVQKDEAPIDDPIDAETADSDQTLAQDEQAAMNPSNIIEGGRTRGAGKPKGTYTEPGDEEGLPGPDDGTSRIATEGTQDPSVKDI